MGRVAERTMAQAGTLQPLPKEHIVFRPTCVLSGADDLEVLCSLPDFPVSMYCVEPGIEDTEWKMDMTWFISKSTGCIRLSQLVDPHVLYAEQHESGGIGGVWLRHHQQFCEFIESFNIRTVLEIGGGHGHLAKMFVEKVQNSTWMMVEPNMPDWLTSGEAPKQIRAIEGWFDENFLLPEDAPTDLDAIVHSHTFEHMYDYHGFLAAVRAHAPKYHIFSVPYQEAWMRNGWQNCIMFEHPQLLTPVSIEYLMQCHGFVLESKNIFENAHSLFYAFRFQEAAIERPPVPMEYAANKALFEGWLLALTSYASDVNKTIEMSPNKDHIYVFGAHIFTQYLVACGLDVSAFAGILDNAQ